MWPGDIDNNGQVAAADLLYFGHSFDSEGPERPGIVNLSWAPIPMGEIWLDTFPDGHNFAYADIDGNGRVTETDFEHYREYIGRIHGDVEDDILLPTLEDSSLNQLHLVPTGFEVREDGNYLIVDVQVYNYNNPSNRVDDVYGMGLRFSFIPGSLRNTELIVKVPQPSWISAEGETTYSMGMIDSVAGVAEAAFTHRDLVNRTGRGTVMTLDLPLSNYSDVDDLAAASVIVEGAVLVDAEMNLNPFIVAASPITVNNTCSFSIDPVTGADGVVYLNPCFAQDAGNTFYVNGAGYGPGIDVTAIDSTANCDGDYDPVCGFNQATYANACVADAHGVQIYSSGMCSDNDFSCYDPNLIVVSSATTVNTFNGVITVDCPASGEAVQGCDGNVYPNACLAEASGVVSYTVIGDGGNNCIDPDQINPDPDCEETQAFVCGCNEVTYINACYAEAAGVTSYSNGPCGGSSSLCDEAISVSCGDYLPNETTIGAGNQITSYPGCSSSAMMGPDRVYVVQKTGAGDLQIGLEIMTPGLDMDIFLLAGDCNDITCLASSTTSNTITNNEGILLEDAPVGTYYIVVDQQQAGVGGNFRLEVSCGYLDCSNSVPLDCGVTYNGSNINGNDDVSLYTCGNTMNVENNGPEVVHTFTTSETGTVTINLTGLSQNLELFLLSSCDRGACLEFSQNPGTNNEQIIRNLPAGTYYVVVDGYNGAISNYSLNVDCNQTCNLVLQPTGTTDADCGQNNGVFNFSVYNGSPTYVATYTGPISGSAVSNTGHFCFVNLPAGTYTYTVQDGSGCTITSTFTIGDQGDLELVLNPFNAGCGSAGAIGVTVGGSLPPFTVVLSGPTTTVQTVNSQSFNLNDLPAGAYTVSVTNSSGCSATESTYISQGNGNLSFVATPFPEGCGNPGRIHIDVVNGQPDFLVQLSGVVNGSAMVDTDDFNIIDLPAGVYQVTITDAFGCSSQQTVVVPSGELEVQVTANPATCGEAGSAVVSVFSGTPPYTVNYFGPSSGSVVSSNNSILIDDLLSGAYTFSVWDNNGCDITETVYVGSSGSDLQLVVGQASGDCSGNTTPVTFNISGGTPSYSLTYSGPASGTVVINGSGVSSLELPPGNYTFFVTDFAGCTTVESFTVVPPQTGLNVNATLANNGCGQLQDIVTTISGGSAPFFVTVTNNCGLPSQTFMTFNTQFTLDDTENCLYNISVEDANGCSGSDQITVNAGNADLLTLIAGDGACGSTGFIDIIVSGGDDPYYITWTGPVSGNVALISPTYRIEDLPSGTYTVSIITNDGCTDEETIVLNNNGGTIDLISTLVFADCGQYDQIWNDIIGGTPPFTVEIVRLCDGDSTGFLTNDDGFELVDLIPCDYKIKVTDANGCMTMNTVTVFPYQLFDAIPDPGICGQPGQIQINIMNAASSAPYQVSFTGPQNGSFPTNNTSFLLSNLMPGTYTITITDNNGCAETETVELEESFNDLDIQVAVISNDCGQYNQLWNDITGGVPPYTIEVTRLCDNTVDTTFVTSEVSFELFDLEECEYKVKVTDANGCMDMETQVVDPSPVDIFTATPVPGPCGALGRIDVFINGGDPPYQLLYSGPQSGSLTVNTNSVSLNDLPAGTYTLILTDANGCSQLETVTVEVTASDIQIISSLIQNDCGQYNQVWNDIIGGTPPFSIEVLRLCDSTQFSTFNLDDDQFELFDLPPCDYKIIVMDAAGCMSMDTVTVFPTPNAFFELDPFNGECNELGGFTINFLMGTPPYTVQYTGPVGDTVVLTDTLSYTVEDLPSGTYTVIVFDSAGCIQTEQATIVNTTTDLELVTAVILNECGQYNQLWNDIIGGVAPYDVEVLRLCDNTVDTTFTTNSQEFELPNLTPCAYKVIVTDATGCMVMTVSDISSTNANLAEFEVGEDCADAALTITFIDGSGPYQVMLMGMGVQLEFNDIVTPTYVISQIEPGDYMVMVTSAEGCVEAEFIDIESNGSGQAPVADFTFSTATLTATFTNTSSDGESFFWDFGDNNGTSNEENPEYEFDFPGTYTVCLTTTNECGSDQFCEDVTVNTGSLMLEIGDGAGISGQVVSLPVTVIGADNISSLAGSFNLDNPAFGQIVGITPVLITPNFNEDDNSFSYFSNAPGGQPLMAQFENLLFYLRVQINANSGQTMVRFSDSPLALELSVVNGAGIPTVMTPEQDHGQINTSLPENAQFDVTVTDYELDPLDNVIFELSPEDNTFLTTVEGDANGYAHLGMQQTAEMYYLNASREDYDPLNGISTFSIYVGQRYLLGLPSPLITSPYQVIAGDVNCSGSFTTLDLFLMQNILLGQTYNFPDCEDWVFIHESTDMPEDWDINNVFDFEEVGAIELMYDTMTSFIGVLRGDMLNNSNPQNLPEFEGRQPMVFKAEVPSVQAGEYFTVALGSNQLEDLVSLQFGLDFDASSMEYLGYEGAYGFENTVISDALAERGKLALSWYPLDGMANATAQGEVVYLRFRALRDISDFGSLTNKVAVSTSGLQAVAHKEDLEMLKPVIELSSPIGSVFENSAPVSEIFRVGQNQPNPLSDLTIIPVDLPQDGPLILTITDAQGRQLLTREQEFSAGRQQITLDLGHLASGLYHYHIRFGEYYQSLPMLIQR
ncbi:hypothetical protein CEQ90_09325 [Lewinellaceae bacterium SD302]|nr:hypothetical protein CEQ90_09325 [Lewinellaceae bacterium SD302]